MIFTWNISNSYYVAGANFVFTLINSTILTGWGQIQDIEYPEKVWQMAGASNPEIL